MCASARAVMCAGEPVERLGELWVGVPPQLPRVGVERDLRPVSGVLQRRGEVLLKAGAFQRFGVAAFGQQPDAAACADQKAVEKPVGELDGGGVPGELGLGDVADDRDVRAGGGRRRGPREQRERPAVPRGAQCRGQRRDLSGSWLSGRTRTQARRRAAACRARRGLALGGRGRPRSAPRHWRGRWSRARGSWVARR